MTTNRWSAVLLAALLCGPGTLALNASARAAEDAGTTQGPRFRTAPAPGTMRVSKVIGVGVVGMDHVRVGTIEDVLLGADGRIETVVIGVGGFLGLGEKYVAVPFDLLAWNVGDVALTAGPTSVATPQNAATTAEAAKAGPQTMPGSDTTRDVLGAVEDKHSGRVTDATGSTEAQKPTGERATVLAGASGNAAVRAELRLTKAELAAAPAFRFDAQDGKQR
ncbi:PRC-barrel domain-containing protein [Methylobacterium sp. J-090]|uniref:PRC-barrel domain-containing protein n=1 Tax=Methylobacterium sp. J-090 TaxID=2836666 RepID=UPI001FB98E26|nr:PRC-barrel domain-containing protein [Methylobacterium sp. J-090]MCJ2080938.1 PRC-barrel domain-containing protein [Methylobacterium sp. J-090]